MHTIRDSHIRWQKPRKPDHPWSKVWLWIMNLLLVLIEQAEWMYFSCREEPVPGRHRSSSSLATSLSFRPSVIMSSRTHKMMFSELQKEYSEEYSAMIRSTADSVMSVDVMEEGIDKISVSNRSPTAQLPYTRSHNNIVKTENKTVIYWRYIYNKNKNNLAKLRLSDCSLSVGQGTVKTKQNTAGRLIFNLRKRDHITPCLIQLHWLPVSHRITYKLCVLMHSIHIRRSPRYLSDIVQSAASRTTRSGLRSAESNDYITPRLTTKFGERSF